MRYEPAPQPQLTPSLEDDIDFVQVEFFLKLDPETYFEEEQDTELLGALATASLGAVGLETLHHLLEGVEHAQAVSDALRPQLVPQQVKDAVVAFRRSGRTFAPGEVKGVWVPMMIPRKTLRMVIRVSGSS